MPTLAFGKKVSPEFRAKVLKVVKELGWRESQASDLMACMAFESAETFSPSIKNAAGSGATGLIQFMPATARGLNTTTEALANMTAVDQLDYVKAYFKPYARRINCIEDMYMAILMPKYISSPLDTTIFSSGVAYRQNSGLDKNKDGIITKIEAASKVVQKLERGLGSAYALSW